MIPYVSYYDKTGEFPRPIIERCWKAYATDAAMWIASEALQIHGGFGYIDQYPLEKLFRDAKLYQIYEGTSEIQRLILGRYTLDGYEPAMESIPKWGSKEAPEF